MPKKLSLIEISIKYNVKVISEVISEWEDRYFLIECDCCKKEVTAPLNSIRRSFNSLKKSYNCDSCRLNTQAKRQQSMKLRSNNTSGLIGVGRLEQEYYQAWEARISIQGKRVFKVRYPDTSGGYVENKMLCAIDREIFILDNNLNTKRNFTDSELKELIKEYKYSNKALSKLEKLKAK